jgi:DNA-directed RNA polymerase subunit RPC12/RpoP
VSKNRSSRSVVRSLLDIKRWQQRLPTASEARPARCPACGTASSPLGGAIHLHGHGTRERQVRGPTGPGDPPELIVITARRYRCVPCGAVILVVPREVVGRRVYSASAIGFALALWGLVLATAAEVRRRASPAKILGDTAVAGWATLRRWARDVARGRLFPSAPTPGSSASLRRIAAGAAAASAASADPTTRALPIEHRAFLGAAHAA